MSISLDFQRKLEIDELLGEHVFFIYKNYKDEIYKRKVKLESVRFGSTDWHKKDQWLVKAFDHDKDGYREFAIKDILSSVEKA